MWLGGNLLVEPAPQVALVCWCLRIPVVYWWPWMNKKASNYRKYKEHKNTTSTICNVVIITRFCSSPQSRTVSCQASSFTSPSPWTPSPTPRLLQWTLRVTLSKYISNLVQLKTFYGQSSCRSGKSLFSFSFLQKQPLSQWVVRSLLTMNDPP